MPSRITPEKANGKRHASQQSLNGAVKSICDIMRRSNCAGALQYVPELTWILFLRILDEQEHREAEEAEALGVRFKPSLTKPYRWRDWAAPESPMRQDKHASVWKFVHEDLLPKLKNLENQPGANARQKVISEIMSSVDRSRIDSEKNFLDVLDKVHEISSVTVDDTHVFTLSQVYEGLLLKMGEKGNDGGQFFTPREVIRAMVRVIDPKIKQTVYDPGCGTGGFLAQAYEYMKAQAGEAITGAFVKTKRKLLEECDVYCIVSLPGGVFTSAGAGVKTNLVFFTKGNETKKIWYYDLSDKFEGRESEPRIQRRPAHAHAVARSHRRAGAGGRQSPGQVAWVGS